MCSALPTELTSQLGAGHYLGSKWTREVVNKRLRIYESHIFALRIKTWMKVILAVMCITWAVVKIRPEKKFRPVRDLNPWPLRYRCSALPTELTSQLGAAPVSQRSWVQIPYGPEFFSGLIFTTAQVVHITARITFIHGLNFFQALLSLLLK